MTLKNNKYAPAAVAVDIVIFSIIQNALHVLLIKRNKPPFQGDWALPGGFLRNKETIEHAALRVLKDKAGLSSVFIEQLYTFDSSGRDPRGHIPSVAYFALVPHEKITFEKGADIQEPTFYPVHALPKLAFDHLSIVKYGIKRLQAKLEYTNVIYSLLPRYFTFSQLQTAYEIILDRRLDKRNFRKKFASLNLIRATKKMLLGGQQRPAKLFEFISHKPAELKKFFS